MSEMPKQLPNIAGDKGVQEEVWENVKNMAKKVVLHGDTMKTELEQALYFAEIQGLRMGFRYGWRLGQIEKEKEMKAMQAEGGEE